MPAFSETKKNPAELGFHFEMSRSKNHLSSWLNYQIKTKKRCSKAEHPSGRHGSITISGSSCFRGQQEKL